MANTEEFIPSWMKQDEEKETVDTSDAFVPAWMTKETGPAPTEEAQEIISQPDAPSSVRGNYSLPGDVFAESPEPVLDGSDQVPHPYSSAKESNQTFSDRVRFIGSALSDPVGTIVGGVRGMIDPEGQAANKETIKKNKELVYGEGGGDGHSRVSDIAGGIWNAPRNVVETGLMVQEALTGQKGLVDSFNEAVPNYRPKEDDTLGEVLTTGSELLTGVGVGGAVGKAGAEALNLGAKGTKVATVTGMLAGETAALDENSDTLAFGENAVLGLGINPGSIVSGDNQGAKGIAKKINVLVDSMAAGAAVKFGTEIGSVILNKSSGIGKSMFQYFNKASREKNLADETIYKIADILPTDTQEEVLKKVQSLGDKVFENNNLLESVLRDNPNLLDGVPDDQKAKLLEKLNINRDVTLSLEAGGASATSVDAARGIRKGAQASDDGSAVKIREGLAEPARRLESEMDEIYGAGRGNLDDATVAVRTEAEERSAGYLDEAASAREAFEKRKDSVNELTKDSPELKGRIDTIAKPVDLDITKTTRDSSERLASSVREAQKISDDTFKAASEKLPDDIFVDKDEIIKIIGDNEGLVDRLGETFKKALLDEDNPSYKAILEDGSKSITRALDAIDKSGAAGGTQKEIEALLKIRKIIREDPKAAYPQYAKELKEFDDAYKDWAKVNKEGLPADYKAVGREFRNQEVDRNVADLDLSRVASKDAYKADHLRETLKTIGKEGDVDQAVMDKAFEVIRSKANQNGDVSVQDLVKSIKSIEGGTLSPKMQADLQDVMTTLRDRQVGLKAEEKVVKRAETEAKQKANKVFRNDFKEFFKDTSDGLKPRGSSKKAFNDLFSNDDNVYKVQDVIKAVAKDGTEEASRGLKSGYVDALKKKLIDPSKEGAAKITAENAEEMLKYGDEIFKDAPGTMDVLRALSDESGLALKSQTGEALKIGKSGKEVRAAILKGVANLVTMRYGPLSRTGARINTVTSRLADVLHPEDTSRFLSELISDAQKGGKFDQELSRVIKEIMKDKTAVENPAYYKEFAKYLTKANLRTPSEIDEFFDYRFKDSLNK